MIVLNRYESAMKKIVAISLIVLCFMSCTYKSITYKYTFLSDPKKDINKRISVRMRIPSDYVYTTSFATWENIDYYTYPDSSVIYVTNYDIFDPNYENIQSLGDTIWRFRLQRVLYNQLLYTELGLGHMIPKYEKLQGKDSNGLYWRDILIEDTLSHLGQGVSFGYINVSKEKKSTYDKIIETAKFKMKTIRKRR